MWRIIQEFLREYFVVKGYIGLMMDCLPQWISGGDSTNFSNVLRLSRREVRRKKNGISEQSWCKYIRDGGDW